MELHAQAPYQTWTQGPNGWLVHTQDAYEPGKLLNPGLKSPEDLFVYDERLYVADTGNARILVEFDIFIQRKPRSRLPSRKLEGGSQNPQPH